MALGAHVVPVLRTPGPVQHVLVVHLVVRIEVEPALAARLLGPAVPGDRQGLQSAAGQFDQVLLQGADAEGIADLEIRQLAVGSVGVDEKPAVALEECGGHARIVETRPVEIAEHALLADVLHRQIVMRALPVFGGAGVAADAGLAPHEAGMLHARCGRRIDRCGVSITHTGQAPRCQQQAQCDQRKHGPSPTRHAAGWGWSSSIRTGFGSGCFHRTHDWRIGQDRSAEFSGLDPSLRSGKGEQSATQRMSQICKKTGAPICMGAPAINASACAQNFMAA